MCTAMTGERSANGGVQKNGGIEAARVGYRQAPAIKTCQFKAQVAEHRIHGPSVPTLTRSSPYSVFKCVTKASLALTRQPKRMLPAVFGAW